MYAKVLYFEKARLGLKSIAILALAIVAQSKTKSSPVIGRHNLKRSFPLSTPTRLMVSFLCRQRAPAESVPAGKGTSIVLDSTPQSLETMKFDSFQGF